MSTGEALTKDKLHWRHVGLAVTAAFFSGICVALMFNTPGIFYKSVADEFGVGLGQVTLYITLSYLFAMALLPIGGRLMDKVDAKIIYVVTNVALTIAFLLFAFAPNVWVMYIGGALMAGGTSFDMYLMPVLVARWFKKRTGFVVGIAGSMTGLGAAVWNPVFAQIMANWGWRAGYLGCAILVAVIIIPLCIIFVRSNPEDVGIKPYGWSETLAAETAAKANEATSGADFARVIKSPGFIFFIVMCMCGGLCAMMSQYMTSFAQSVGYEAMVGAWITSAAFIGTMAAKIILGAVADKSPTAAIAGAVIMPIIGFIGLMAIGGSSVPLIVLMGFMYGTVQPSNTVLAPLVVQKAYGDKDYGRIWGAISPFSALACAIGATIWGWIYDGTGTFYGVFTIGIILLCIRMVVYLLGWRNAKKIPWTSSKPEAQEAVAEA